MNAIIYHILDTTLHLIKRKMITPTDDVILNKDLTRRLTKLDETRLNKTINANVPTHVLSNLIRTPLPKLSHERYKIRTAIVNIPNIPQSLQQAILNLKLYDESNVDKRVQMFIGYCLYMNYSSNTVHRYFSILRANNVFGRGEHESKLRMDPTVFSDRGRIHTRLVRMENFKKLTLYLHEHLSQYTAPLLLAVYTGLRTSEILQFTAMTLYQLLMRHPSVRIQRKQTIVRNIMPSTTTNSTAEETATDANYWQPIYNSHFMLFIDILIDLYRIQYDALVTSNQNSKLFNVTPKTLANRIKHLYFNACDSAPPNGFGVHSCRNLIAQLMSENTDNIVAIQAFLQHRNISTTRQYIKADFTHTTQTFNRLTDYALSSVRANIALKPEEK